jgi:hypothetical protein
VLGLTEGMVRGAVVGFVVGPGWVLCLDVPWVLETAFASGRG